MSGGKSGEHHKSKKILPPVTRLYFQSEGCLLHNSITGVRVRSGRARSATQQWLTTQFVKVLRGFPERSLKTLIGIRAATPDADLRATPQTASPDDRGFLDAR